jgi:uncharacterized protein DUF1707/cell wall-active antibiotic response 4TMS protein YvqF
MKPELRVSDAEREQAALVLRDACADGRITLDELSDRLDTVYGARTRAELDAVVDDLPSQAVALPVRSPRRWAVAIMAGTSLRGRWRLDRRLTSIAFMGGASIDLRGAEVSGPEATIVCVSLMGGIDVIVPEGMPVEVGGISIMGGRDTRVRDTAWRPGVPALRVRAYSVMGGVCVRSKAPAVPGGAGP